MPRHHILFIDAYDSFSNSIIALLQADLPVTVECIKIDDERFILNDEAFFHYLDHFDAVVVGPGPGHPSNPADVGLIGKLWSLPDDHCLPVLGICLGFQSLCLALGASIERLREPRHGIMAIVTHCGKDIFAETGKIVATLYHSLHATLQKREVGDEWGAWDLWKPSGNCPDLLPLAWSLMNVSNGPVLMAARHHQKPFWGVQYHPESICTSNEGRKLVANWWAEVCDWRVTHPVPKPRIGDWWGKICNACGDDDGLPKIEESTVQWLSTTQENLIDAAVIVDMLREGDPHNELLLLESGTRKGSPVNSETGRYTIIGVPGPSSRQIRYRTANKCLEAISEGVVMSRKQTTVAHAFEYIDQVMRANRAVGGSPSVPFWGGLIGFISYEAGLETIDVPATAANEDHPDIMFVFVERSIVIDHVGKSIYFQSVHANDQDWLHTTQHKLKMRSGETAPQIHLDASAHLTSGPDKDVYCQKVRDCQSKLRAGESYELCLTDQSTITTTASPWMMYRQLRDRNPAPFSSYLRISSPNLPGISVVGSSPERFLSWSRGGTCQFRPIKGTVKKTPGVTRARAEEILGSAKERAENLMIVDLIRHDLAGVPGVRRVRVPKLMAVEEYETVFQLVSVIEGDMDSAASGPATLAASLPPGSMTGAPKKRSCELLKLIEGGRPRGLYSGVIGYFDVGGGGDFSVVIRTAFKWDRDGDGWRVGAGGAITALSEADAEWEEMVVKRESVLNSLL
jgi:para-aminobenzoate synthetase